MTIPFFVVVTLFTYEEFEAALIHSSLILGGIFLPVGLNMYLKSKNGRHTNFDISNKTQRQSWYVFPLLLLLLVSIILFITNQPRTLSLAVLFSLILLVISQVVNYFIKSSLHVSLNIFLSFLLIPMNLAMGALLLLFTIFIGWARIELERHTATEVFTGAVIGLMIGVSTLFFI